MKLKWCYFFVIIALIGFASQQQVCLPNQEIIFRFDNEEVTTVETQNAVDIVKKQLQLIGADNIQVILQNGGSVKITYYSNTDIASVKKLFSKEKDIEFGYVATNQDGKHSNIPLKEHAKSFNLDIFEIQKKDTGLNINGKFALENKFDKTRFFNPHVPVSSNINIDNHIVSTIDEDCNFQNYNVFAINNTSHRIPDGRAGPLA